MGTPVEWLLFWSYVLVMVATHWAYRDLKRDAEGVRERWPLSDEERRKAGPVTQLAVTHERFRLTKQFTGLVASALCLYIPGELGTHGQVMRTALLILCALMLLNTLNGVRSRRRYFQMARQMEARKAKLETLAQKETA